MISESFSKKFDLERLTVFKTNYWILSVRPKQLTKGSLILAYLGEESELGDLCDDAFLELRNLMRNIEVFAKKQLKCVIVNYLVLRLVDSELHFHIFPRYDTKHEDTDNDSDPFFPFPVDLSSSSEVDFDLNSYIDSLKVCFNDE